MTVGEMFGQSAILTLVGMGTVFLFLAILIVTVSLVAKIVKALKWDKDLYGTGPAAAATSPSSATGANVAAAITSALHKFRKRG